MRGHDRIGVVPLPEIPPYEARLATRWTMPGHPAGRVELGGRFVAEATRVDPDFPENRTPSFEVWHARCRSDLGPSVAVEAGIESLLDAQYRERLTREATNDVPWLVPGQEIPRPGRHLGVALLIDL